MYDKQRLKRIRKANKKTRKIMEKAVDQIVRHVATLEQMEKVIKILSKQKQ